MRFNPKNHYRLTMLVFLILIYPLLGMLWHHDYPIFSASERLYSDRFVKPCGVVPAVAFENGHRLPDRADILQWICRQQHEIRLLANTD